MAKRPARATSGRYVSRLTSGTLARYISEDAVTGLTSNPTIFDHAIKNSSRYDAAIRKKVKEGKSGEDLFFELALEDLTRAADLFRPIWDRTHGVDGWVSLEVSPELAKDTQGTIAAAKDPIIAFPGHWAPMSLAFYPSDKFGSAYSGGLFIAFHGSWNRAPLPQAGFRVVFAPFADGKATGSYTTFASGPTPSARR